MEFCYGPDGNRLLKIVKTKTSGVINPEIDWTYTYYVRDAQGNTMATYDVKKQGDDWKMVLNEFTIHGNSRLGLIKGITGTEIIAGEAPILYASDGTGSISFTGLKLETLVAEEYALLQPWQLNYELSNFRGDVQVVITADSKTICDGDFMAYAPQIQSAIDMYSFGMEMPERTDPNTGSDYRFGFGGKERDNEVKGSGNSLDFGARIYDPRLGRFLSKDPHENKYAWQSAYCYAANNPIRFIDVDGKGPDDPPTYSTPDGGTITVPAGTKVTTYAGGCYIGAQSCNEIDVLAGSVRSFEYKGVTYSATYTVPSGKFAGYQSNTKEPKQLSYSSNTLPEHMVNAGSVAAIGLAVTRAAITSQVDGPEPGPADVVAAIDVTVTAFAQVVNMVNLANFFIMELPKFTAPVDATKTMDAAPTTDQGEAIKHMAKSKPGKLTQEERNQAHGTDPQTMKGGGAKGDKHTARRSGRSTTKNRQNKEGWKQNPNRR